MSAHFYLDRRKGKAKRLPVFLHFWHEGKLLRVFTGEHCDSKDWSRKRERVKKKGRNAPEVNMILDDMEQELMRYVKREKLLGRQLTINDIRANVSFINGSDPGFFEVWDRFIYEHMKNRMWKESTVNRFWALKGHLLSLNEQKPIHLKSISSRFLKEFVAYQKSKGLSPSYIKQNLDQVRWFLNWAGIKGYVRNLDYKNYKTDIQPSALRVRPQVFLTRDELNRFYRVKTSGQLAEVVKDSFCFACMTGMSHADMCILAHDQLNGNRLFYAPLKSARGVTIELTGIIKEIINKYRSSSRAMIFPMPGIQQYNRMLKELGRAAGITSRVSVTKGNGEKEYKKHELLSSQVSRRTFIMLSIDKGISLEVMSEMTGVAPASLQKFFTVTPEKLRRELTKLDHIKK